MVDYDEICQNVISKLEEKEEKLDVVEDWSDEKMWLGRRGERVLKKTRSYYKGAKGVIEHLEDKYVSSEIDDLPESYGSLELKVEEIGQKLERCERLHNAAGHHY